MKFWIFRVPSHKTFENECFKEQRSSIFPGFRVTQMSSPKWHTFSWTSQFNRHETRVLILFSLQKSEFFLIPNFFQFGKKLRLNVVFKNFWEPFFSLYYLVFFVGEPRKILFWWFEVNIVLFFKNFFLKNCRSFHMRSFLFPSNNFEEGCKDKPSKQTWAYSLTSKVSCVFKTGQKFLKTFENFFLNIAQNEV